MGKVWGAGHPDFDPRGRPEQFWEPIDKTNERWLELKRHALRRHDTDAVKWETIMVERHNIFRKHRKTKFINAHLRCFGSDLKKIESTDGSIPQHIYKNWCGDCRTRSPARAAKAVLTNYQDRVPFSKDSWVPDEYETYFRVLETKDEYFPYHKRYHAFWRMYGIGLPDEILNKTYYKNALRLLPNMDAGIFPK